VHAERGIANTAAESIQTPHGYIEADLAIKGQALQKLAPAGSVD
jgi:hypothetical protein